MGNGESASVFWAQGKSTPADQRNAFNDDVDTKCFEKIKREIRALRTSPTPVLEVRELRCEMAEYLQKYVSNAQRIHALYVQFSSATNLYPSRTCEAFYARLRTERSYIRWLEHRVLQINDRSACRTIVDELKGTLMKRIIAQVKELLKNKGPGAFMSATFFGACGGILQYLGIVPFLPLLNAVGVGAGIGLVIFILADVASQIWPSQSSPTESQVEREMQSYLENGLVSAVPRVAALLDEAIKLNALAQSNSSLEDLTRIAETVHRLEKISLCLCCRHKVVDPLEVGVFRHQCHCEVAVAVVSVSLKFDVGDEIITKTRLPGVLSGNCHGVRKIDGLEVDFVPAAVQWNAAVGTPPPTFLGRVARALGPLLGVFGRA